MSKEVEKVSVNGMTMYKWGNQLFLTEEEAVDAIRKSRVNDQAKMYGYILDDYDPFALLMAGEILRGIRL